ncbi:uncharacterized protein LOC141648847 [Silene latifolia]|uniref:uncharacterized protein LOC141648847 n=1 Tax=Silene latifolia TaxID=37657 RepID=UPI003D7793FC
MAEFFCGGSTGQVGGSTLCVAVDWGGGDLGGGCGVDMGMTVMDQPKHGITGVQTLRNNLTASTVLATIAITLCSLISALISSYTYTIHNFKYFSVLMFSCSIFLQCPCVRFFSHASFLLTVPFPETGDEYIEHVAETIKQGSLLWSLVMRAFYFSFPLLLWIFGPSAMFTCSCLMSVFQYFLDIMSNI